MQPLSPAPLFPPNPVLPASLRPRSLPRLVPDGPEHYPAVGNGRPFPLRMDKQGIYIKFTDFRLVGNHIGE